MNFGNLKTLARKYVPAAKVSSLPDTTLELILNEGMRDVAFITAANKTNIKFNVSADTNEYNLTDIDSNFLLITEPGLWWKSTTWTQLKARTIRWLDENRKGWRDASSGDPEFYAKDGDVLFIYPTPSASQTNGFHLYYTKSGSTMADSNHYPFHKDNNQEAEISRLRVLSESILLYWRWKAYCILSKSEAEKTAARDGYKKEVTEKAQLLRRRLDVSEDMRT